MITKDIIDLQPIQIQQQESPIVVNRFEMAKLRFLVSRQLFKIIYQKVGGIIATFKLIREVKQKYQKIFGEAFLTKASKVDGRYFWRLAAPGFPSAASFEMQKREVSRFIPDQPRTGLRSLIFAITKKCTLNCEHCFEWYNLNQPETLSVEEIISIIHKYQDFGTTQIMLSGGEPMLRIKDIYKILKAARPWTDFWIITSGIGLHADRAQRLKAAGLTGVMVSLDHYVPAKHNQFRGNENAFNWAIEAVLNAKNAGLVTTLSICVTKFFVTHDNLAKYMKLAKKLGVTFVQILEARAAGRYGGKEVDLSEKQLNILKEFYLGYSNSPKYTDYPIINYLGYHQRKAGCFGAGDRFFYIDTNGDAHICPYCVNKVGNTIEKSANEMIDLLAEKSCFTFEKNTVL